MITPKFSCSQTDSAVIISLYVPSVRASEVEINVDGTLFSVHINPYFLRLHLPSNVIEDDDSSAKYDPGTGYLIVTLTKETKGEDFPDLDLLAKLLVPPGTVDKEREHGMGRKDDGPLIEVLDETGSGSGELEDGKGMEVEALAEETGKMTLNKDVELDLEREREVLLEAEQHDWHYPQTTPDNLPSLAGVTRLYGFLDAYSGYFKHVAYSDNEVNELGEDAEHLTMDERRDRRLKSEEAKWDPEYYLADYVKDEDIQKLIQWKSPYDLSNEQQDVEFTDDENAAILRLPRKAYLATTSQTRCLYLTLLEILFSYAYDLRTTQDDPTPESAWTISSLTPAFSALDTSPSQANLATTLTASYRRALAFPLYRKWQLCERCREDVVHILQGGRRGVTRALLRLKKLLDRHETYYIYSKIWVNDYVVWVQAAASDETLGGLSAELHALHLPKAAIGWSLEELEGSALGMEPDSDDEDVEEDSSQRRAPL